MIHKILVLLKIIESPTMAFVLTDEEEQEFNRAMDEIFCKKEMEGKYEKV